MASARNPPKRRPSPPPPGSPVTPALRDPSAGTAGLHLLCLAASGGPSAPAPQVALASPPVLPPRPPPPAAARAPPAYAFAHAPPPPPPFAHALPFAGGAFLTAPPAHHVLSPPAYLPYALFHAGGVPLGAPLYASCARSSSRVGPPPRAPSARPAPPHSSPLPASPPPPSSSSAAPGAARRVKGPWRPEEDALLTGLVSRFGARRWTAIAAHIPGRTGKQARERWLNQLSPDLAKRAWSAAEDRVVMEAHARLGNRWSEIAKLLDGRTDNAVKNRFNTTIRRQISEISEAARAKQPKPAPDSALETSDASSCDEQAPRRKRKAEEALPQEAAERVKVMAVSA